MRAISAPTVFGGLGAMLVLSLSASAELGACHLDKYNSPICAPPGGGIVLDRFDSYVCGRGQCVRSRYGSIVCSRERGGGAIIDHYGSPKCVGGCEDARSDYCVAPR